MASKKRRVAVEWFGGLASMPAYVAGDGEPYRPEVLLWMLADGPVVGFTTAKPGQMLAGAAAHLRDTMRKPMYGRPHTPDLIRVASPALAETLRDELPTTFEVVCAPTPEIDAVMASMRERMGEDPHAERSYLSAKSAPMPWPRSSERRRASFARSPGASSPATTASSP